MAYPSTILNQTNPSGTSTVDSVDHASQHTNVNNDIVGIENTLGTNSGTNVLKNFAAGDFPSRINSSNVPQQILSSGTINNAVIGTPSITGGTSTNIVQNNGTLGTPTIVGGTIAGSGTTVPISVGVNLAPTVGTLADSSGGTITPNAQAATIFQITLGTNATNRTIGTPTNPTDGEAITFRIKNNAAGVGTILWASVFRFSNSGTPTIGTAATWSYFAWRYSSTDTKWDFIGSSLSLI